jgi:hypothetical protein
MIRPISKAGEMFTKILIFAAILSRRTFVARQCIAKLPYLLAHVDDMYLSN